MHQLPSLKITDHFESRFLLFDSLATLWNHATGRAGDDTGPPPFEPVIVVVDSRVRSAHYNLLEEVFPAGSNRYFEVPPGERSKSIEMWSLILDFAFEGSLRRNTSLVAVGGGITGDLAGFAAASLMRGIPLYHVPTTLLAMVDSAIGGKTGINHPYGKNTIGAFYHPEAVLFDTTFLETLPQREWLCGISEVLKYGYISDPALIDRATRLADPAGRNDELIRYVIEKSVSIKSDIVTSDAREAGKRAWLNFGHTFAHALETLGDYRNINHGEAVYAGMIAALYVSRQLGAPVSDHALVSLKNIYNLDLSSWASHSDDLVSLMEHDKKNRDRSIQLVVLDDIGKPVLRRLDERYLLKDAWQYVFDVLNRP